MQHKTKKIKTGKARRQHKRMKINRERRMAVNKENKRQKHQKKLMKRLAKEQDLDIRPMQGEATKRAIEERLSESI